MEKNNKELTVEVVCAYLTALGNNENTTVPCVEDLPKILNTVHDAITNINKPRKSE